MDYSKGKIYKIIDLTNDDIYIGSTIQTLKQRWASHLMFQTYDKNKEECDIILVEDYPCESRRQLEEREQYHIDNTECINKTRAHRPNEFINEDRKKRNITSKNNQREKLKDQSYRDKYNKQASLYMRERRVYEKSWAGDKRYYNNLLMIDTSLFLVD